MSLINLLFAHTTKGWDTLDYVRTLLQLYESANNVFHFVMMIISTPQTEFLHDKLKQIFLELTLRENNDHLFSSFKSLWCWLCFSVLLIMLYIIILLLCIIFCLCSYPTLCSLNVINVFCSNFSWQLISVITML